LFGHVKGAFTGAERVRLGLFRQASGGTLFLDDIDTAALTLQAKILHAVECGQVMPLGADQPVAVDVRILAASNTDLRAAAAGRFRQDLYYRLGNLALTLPALRERGEEIPSLARMFLRETCDDLGREVPVLDPAAAALLMAHSWPGNIRELKSLMRNLAVFAETAVTVEMVRNQIAQTPPDSGANRPHTSAVPTLEQAEIAAILAALRAAKGGKMEAARLLAIDYQRFKRKLLKYGLAG
jgi:DNA-binding NtrC family response regulator